MSSRWTDVGRRDRALDIYTRARHARFLKRGCVYHVLSRTVGNMFLLRPDLEGELRAIIAGILAQARMRYPSIAIYAAVVLSNHMLIGVLEGDPRVAADFIGFFKREVTRRWCHHVNWSRSMWEGYRATAVITPEAQQIALRYLLQHGVKEIDRGRPSPARLGPSMQPTSRCERHRGQEGSCSLPFLFWLFRDRERWCARFGPGVCLTSRAPSELVQSKQSEKEKARRELTPGKK